MALVVHAFEKLLCHYEVYWSKRMDKRSKMEEDYHGQRWTTWFLWKEGVKVSHIHRPLSENCGEKAPAGSTAFNWVRSFYSGNETAQAAVRE
jgi:hypothetical protein